MGLDAVEIVLRTEDLFGISIADAEASMLSTVGDLYHLICARLAIPPLVAPVTSSSLPVITQKDRAFLFGEQHAPLPAPHECLPWSPQSVWDALVAVFVDQMSLDADEIIPTARISQDLGID